MCKFGKSRGASETSGGGGGFSCLWSGLGLIMTVVTRPCRQCRRGLLKSERMPLLRSSRQVRHSLRISVAAAQQANQLIENSAHNCPDKEQDNQLEEEYQLSQENSTKNNCQEDQQDKGRCIKQNNTPDKSPDKVKEIMGK